MEIPTLKDSNIETKDAEKKSPVKTQCKSKKLIKKGEAYGTGGRKSSTARVWIKPGNGKITVNKKDVTEYFCREIYITTVRKPFMVTKTNGQFDVVCTVKGGGTTGQAGAIAHGSSRALSCISDEHHTLLKKEGLLTRDSRVVERKKYGKRKARKSAQFSKR